MCIFTAVRNLAERPGWQVLGVSFIAGALLALAFAPYGFWPLIFISLPILYTTLHAATSVRQSILRAFLFGYGYFMAGTWWIAKAMLVDVEKFGWLMPISILGLSAAMAAWFALFGWLIYMLRARHVAVNLFLFATLWVLVEFLRSLGMFGFPWNLLGYTALASLPVAQMASVVGVYGLSFFVVLLGVAPLLWQTRYRYLAWVAPLLMIAAAYSYGAWRIPATIEMTETRLRIVQPSVPQSLKWTAEGKEDSLRTHAGLMRAPYNASRPDLIIWSETAFPFTLRANSPWPARLGSILAANQILLTGAVLAEGEEENTKLWNGFVGIDGQGVVQARYEKHQLVPFGEFMPFRGVLPLDKITPGTIDFSRGAGVRTLHVAGVPPFSPLICYEVIFPWLAADAHDRPEWLLNVTNDGWYGNSAGPYQHFAMARMRAIEQGLPLVRAANNGISAVIDPYGRVVAALPLNAQDVLDSALPKQILPTRESLSSAWFAWIILFVTFLSGLVRLIRKLLLMFLRKK